MSLKRSDGLLAVVIIAHFIDKLSPEAPVAPKLTNTSIRPPDLQDKNRNESKGI